MVCGFFVRERVVRMSCVDISHSENEQIREAFLKLPLFTQRAIKLLRWARFRAVQGVGNHSASGCPISRAYQVGVDTNRWGELRLEVRRLLRKRGWNHHLFRSFMNWYDNFNAEERRAAESLLYWALRQKRLPRAKRA